jgi:hypothetical protein
MYDYTCLISHKNTTFYINYINHDKLKNRKTLYFMAIDTFLAVLQWFVGIF